MLVYVVCIDYFSACSVAIIGWRACVSDIDNVLLSMNPKVDIVYLHSLASIGHFGSYSRPQNGRAKLKYKVYVSLF